MLNNENDNRVDGMSIAEAARFLGIGKTKTKELIKTGILESRKVGPRRLVCTDSAHAFRQSRPGSAGGNGGRAERTSTHFSSQEKAGQAFTHGSASDFRLGYWAFNNDSSGFVVFDDDDGIRKAFLLADWNGHPGYTRIALTGLVDCQFVAEVQIELTVVGFFTKMQAMLGKLVIKDGKAFLSTVDDKGRMSLVNIAPLYDPEHEAGEYFYSWALMGRSTAISSLEFFHQPSNGLSWLNSWISPEYAPDEDETCPSCGEGSLVMNMHSSLISYAT